MNEKMLDLVEHGFLLTGEIANLIDEINLANHCNDASYMLELEEVNNALTEMLIHMKQTIQK